MSERTPEEIKKALKCCGETPPNCKECPYDIKGRIGCKGVAALDALAYIEQLEAERDKLKRELAAAVKDIESSQCCTFCKHNREDMPCEDSDFFARDANIRTAYAEFVLTAVNWNGAVFRKR